HAADLVFTAATRLLAARQKRIRHLAIRDRLLAAGERVLPASMRTRAGDRRAAITRNIASPREKESYYRHIARTMIGLCLTGPAIVAVRLLEQCDALFRKTPWSARSGCRSLGKDGKVPARQPELPPCPSA